MATTADRGRVATRRARAKGPSQDSATTRAGRLRTHGVAGHGQRGQHSVRLGRYGRRRERRGGLGAVSVVTVCFSEVALGGRRHEGDRRTGERPETGALLVPPSTPGVLGSAGSTGVGGQRTDKKKRDGPGTSGVTRQRGQQLKPLRPLTGLPSPAWIPVPLSPCQDVQRCCRGGFLSVGHRARGCRRIPHAGQYQLFNKALLSHPSTEPPPPDQWSNAG